MFRLRLLQVLLIYYLDGAHLLGLHAGDFVASCEPSLAQELATDILSDSFAFVLVWEAFLDDGALFGVLGYFKLILFFLYKLAHFEYQYYSI